MKLKTAISIPDEIFEAAEFTAKTLGVSRSELCATAVREFVARYRRDDVTTKLNALYGSDKTSSHLEPCLTSPPGPFGRRDRLGVKRGEIWWAELSKPRGSEPSYRWQVLVVHADAFNRSQICTVVALFVRSNVSLADAAGSVLLGKRSAGLNRDSVVNMSQVITLDKTS